MEQLREVRQRCMDAEDEIRTLSQNAGQLDAVRAQLVRLLMLCARASDTFGAHFEHSLPL